jgi:hypothetical protein
MGMKLFLSWSGEISKKVALIFYDWIPSVIQSIEPYISIEDIEKGARWGNSISSELEQSSFGILFVTPDNIKAPWLNFEAGALSKAINISFVSPFLFGVKNSDLSGPLVQFQSTLFDKEEIKKLVNSINKSCSDGALTETRLNSIFEKWWPDLESSLKELQLQLEASLLEVTNVHLGTETVSSNKTDDILEEILELTRNLQRTIKSPNELFPKDFLDMVVDNLNIRNSHPSGQAYLDLSEGLHKLNYLLEKDEAETILKDELREIVKRLEKPINHLIKRSVFRDSHRGTTQIVTKSIGGI